MTNKPVPVEQQRQWVVEEVHGIWWAWFPPRPKDEEFVSHASRPSRLLGPFHNKAYAEERLAKHLSGEAKPKL